MITSVTDNKMRVWRVILQYYEIKGGTAYNEAPHRKLANSFGIDSMSNSEASVKHSLLTAIGQILETHRLYRRGDEAHFKAFICLALNEKKLVAWLRQIFRTPAIAEQYYEPLGLLGKDGFRGYILCAKQTKTVRL
ncbi:hypothetical protein EB796_016168 [Bugula neritina]|uniref:RUN domain-containing protein n=1 Tax=Bugula neritina TaxID=10212 RepID=A0A7J7JHD1_BUGNE|nr:hypothetical protein EB796_016168 [Bugula neritina]